MNRFRIAAALVLILLICLVSCQSTEPGQAASLSEAAALPEAAGPPEDFGPGYYPGATHKYLLEEGGVSYYVYLSMYPTEAANLAIVVLAGIRLGPIVYTLYHVVSSTGEFVEAPVILFAQAEDPNAEDQSEARPSITDPFLLTVDGQEFPYFTQDSSTVYLPDGTAVESALFFLDIYETADRPKELLGLLQNASSIHLGHGLGDYELNSSDLAVFRSFYSRFSGITHQELTELYFSL